jgi:hypothetical protein
MLTTTTETDISVNYRWGEMAFYNADAALEYGKNVLATYAFQQGDFSAALPPWRPDVLVSSSDDWGEKIPESPDCGDPRNTAGCRDYQYYFDHGPVDSSNNYTRVYIGRVLREFGTGRPIQYDFRQPADNDTRGDIDGDGTTDIEGTVTLWIRRPVVGNQDADSNGVAVLTAEGTAPNYMVAAGTGRPGSLRRLEMTVSLGDAGVIGDLYSHAGLKGETSARIDQEGWREVVVVR